MNYLEGALILIVIVAWICGSIKAYRMWKDMK